MVPPERVDRPPDLGGPWSVDSPGASRYGGPPGPTWGTAFPVVPAIKPPQLPVQPREYHEFYRAPANRWWKPLVAILTAAAAWFLGTIVVMLIAWLLDPSIVGGTPSKPDLKITPIAFLANNVAIALAVPISYLTQWLVFGQRPKWLSSVVGGFRWGWFGRCVAILLPLWVGMLAVEVLISGEGLSGLAPNSSTVLLAVGILLTTPFQAAGEELALRGLMTRSLAAWIPNRQVGLIFAAIVTSAVFAALHGAGDPWLNAFYLVFAVVATVLVWRTGGLEAAIAMHIVNNMVGEVTMPFRDISGEFERGAGTADPTMLIQLGVILVALVLLLWQAKRLKLISQAAPAAPVGPAATSAPPAMTSARFGQVPGVGSPDGVS